MRRASRFLTLLPQLVLAAALAPGCDIQDQDAPVEERLCERFDECNFLAPGFAVGDCIDTQYQCTDGLVDSQYEDWKADMQECLSLNSCGNTFDCWGERPVLRRGRGQRLRWRRRGLRRRRLGRQPAVEPGPVPVRV